jgi:carboxylate-amine ligase
VAAIAERFDMRIVAASTHPFSSWDEQRHTDAERYRSIVRDYQAIARRSAICGMHVHVSVGDDEQRIRLMDRMVPHLPLLLALSTSSPFWAGQETGLKAFRPTVFGDFPRTGMPERFASWADWQALLGLLADTEVCPDPTKIWWDLRPSAKHMGARSAAHGHQLALHVPRHHADEP